jgi:hypothetical protein
MNYAIQIYEPGKSWDETPVHFTCDDMLMGSAAKFAKNLAALYKTKIRLVENATTVTKAYTQPAKYFGHVPLPTVSLVVRRKYFRKPANKGQAHISCESLVYAFVGDKLLPVASGSIRETRDKLKELGYSNFEVLATHHNYITVHESTTAS